MSESTSSMSDSTSHDNGESTEYKHLSLSLVDLLHIYIHNELNWHSSWQAAELAQRICITCTEWLRKSFALLMVMLAQKLDAA